MHGSHNATNEDQSPYDSGMNWPGQDSYIEMPTEKKRKRALKYGAAALGLGLAAPHAINVANAGLHAAPGAALGALKSVGSTLADPMTYKILGQHAAHMAGVSVHGVGHGLDASSWLGGKAGELLHHAGSALLGV